MDFHGKRVSLWMLVQSGQAAVSTLSQSHAAVELERERESYTKRSCVDLRLGVMGRAPWCKPCRSTT
jgi:hypothetical protein